MSTLRCYSQTTTILSLHILSKDSYLQNVSKGCWWLYMQLPARLSGLSLYHDLSTSKAKRFLGDPQGIWPWRSAGFDYKTSGGNRDSSLGGHKQNLACTKTQRKGAVTHRRLNLIVLEGLLWVSRGSPQGWGHWQQQSRKVSLGINPLGGHH